MDRFDELKLKYQSVLNLIAKKGVRLAHLHVQDNKLVIQGAAPSQDTKNVIWNQIKACHGGQVNDSRFGMRMSGDGKIAEAIKQLFVVSKKKYLSGRSMGDLNYEVFRRPPKNGQMELW